MIKTYYLAKILFKLHIPSFKHCTIHSTAKVNAGCVFSDVRMGRYSYSGDSTYITDAIVGSFCSIGSRCQIGGGGHPLDYVSTSPVFLKGHNFLGINFSSIPYVKSETVVIGNDVWVGDGAYIKSGVHIENGAVIGAHAVVTHDVGPYEIVAGVPAKTIRKRFDDETIQALIELQWWNWDENKLKKNGGYFDNPRKLINYHDEKKNTNSRVL